MFRNNKITMKRAVFINAMSNYLNIAISIVVSAILARLIAPSDYGVMAIVTVFSVFFSTLSDMGLATAIIQDKTLNKKDINNIFSFSIYISIFLMLVFYFLSYIIAAFYNKHNLISLGHWLSISLLFNSMNMVPNGVLNREKRFLEMAIRNIIVYIITAIVTIGVALLGFGIYALIVQSILSSILLFLWSQKLTNLKFAIKIEKESIKKIARYSGFQYAFSMLNYFSRNLDNILVGRFIGSTELAYYNRAYTLMLYPVNNITGVITPVLHPILSDYQNDRKYIYKQYIKIIKLIAIISVYIEVYCFYSAQDIITFLYGKNWGQSINCFAILSIAIATQMITGTTGSIYQAIGETRLLFIAGSINAIITVLTTIFGIAVGSSIYFLAICVSFSYICHFFISFFIMMRFGFKQSYFSFLKELFVEASMFCVLMFFGYVCPFKFNVSIINLLFKGIYFLVIYIVCLIVTKEYKVFEMLKKKRVVN